jgi:hypothetical protein
MAPILTDIENCNLPNVSWVIPDGSWSDHAGTSDGSTDAGIYGPSWVSAIVNGVGNNYGNKQCVDSNGLTYWQDTVIIVVWDDWGGWYDHVLPWNCTPYQNGQNGTCQGYGQNTKSGSYVYGFRVPMLVISAYNISPGYISGACGTSTTPPCPNFGSQQVGATKYVHDFGSILNFIEWAFGTGSSFLSLSGQANLNKGISPSYPFADVQAQDSYLSGQLNNNNNCPKTLCPYSLSDFFNFSQTARGFVPITTYAYPPSVFENWTYNDGNLATDPDTDAYQSQ